MWNDYNFPITFYKNMTIVEQMKDMYFKYNNNREYPLVQYQDEVGK